MTYSKASAIVEAAAAGSTQVVTFNSLAANSTVVLMVAVRNATATAGLVTSVTSSPSVTWTNAVSSIRTPDDGGGTGRQGVYLFTANTGANTGTFTITINFTITSGNLVAAQAAEFTGLASSPIDQTATGTAANAATSISAGPTSTTTVAAEDVVAAVSGKWWWDFNAGDNAPSGFTKVGSQTNNSYLPFQLAYKSVTSTGTQSASWTVPDGNGDGGTAAILTLKAGSTGTLKTRIAFKSGSGINGVTGLTVKVWRGNPDSNYSTTYTGVAAEAAGDLVYCTAPAGASNGETVNVAVFKTGYASEYGTGTIVTV